MLPTAARAVKAAVGNVALRQGKENGVVEGNAESKADRKGSANGNPIVIHDVLLMNRTNGGRLFGTKISVELRGNFFSTLKYSIIKISEKNVETAARRFFYFVPFLLGRLSVLLHLFVIERFKKNDFHRNIKFHFHL